LCAYVPTQNTKRGPKPKITKKISLRIKQAFSIFQDAGQKVNSRKIVKTTEVKVSIRTVQRHLMGMQLKYKRVLPAINLTKAHRAKRIAEVTKWFEDQHC